jgi:ubiquinone/menaquinone biosynthesis C-methylase UbiE
MANPEAGSHAQRGAWQSAETAAAHHRTRQRRSQSHGPATEIMLDLADLQPGNRILDVAAGTGDQTVRAAQRVGSTGYVLATDIAASMLEIAAQAARDTGLTNVETQVMDTQRLDLAPESFDAAISRNGLMFIPDLHAALAGIQQALKPGGRFAAVVYSTVEKNPYHGVPLAIAERYQRVGDESGQYVMFALGNPAGLEESFAAAGFQAVAVHEVSTAWEFASAEDLVRSQQDGFPLLAKMLAALSKDQQERVWTEVKNTMRQFDNGDKVSVPGELLIAVGTK